MTNSHSKFLGLTASHWSITIAILIIIVFIGDIVVPFNPLHGWYYKRMIGPTIEKEYGFHAIVVRKYDQDFIQIERVISGGAFDNAGIKAGSYVVFQYSMGSPPHPAQHFYGNLRRYKGQQVIFMLSDSIESGSFDPYEKQILLSN